MKNLVIAALALVALSVVPLAEAGRLGGRGNDLKRCEAYGSVTYYETFRGGEIATVAIFGDGDTDLDLFVYDRFGNLIVGGTSYSDRETVSFVVPSTATYRVVVRNLGSVWNRYGLATN